MKFHLYYLSCRCFTAPCTKFFQLLLGEVNDCTNWRVSSISYVAKF